MRYQARLDGLRCIAIFLVLLQHLEYFIGGRISGGFYGVNLFFALSGFLITSILINQEGRGLKKDYLNFIGRRILRIFPIYYLTLLFLWIIQTPGIKEDILYLLTYTYNFKMGDNDVWERLYSPYWSLSVEEQFYIFFPVIVILLRNQPRWLLVVTFLFIVAGYLQYLFNIFGIAHLNYVGLLTNMATLAMGAMAAVLAGMKKLPGRFFNSLFVEVIVFVALILTMFSTSWLLRLLVCPVLSTILVVKAARFNFSVKLFDRFLISKPAVFIGKISYGMYVYHQIVAFYFITYLFTPIWQSIPFPEEGIISKIYYNAWLIRFPLTCLLIICVSWVSFKLIEEPLLRYKDKFFRYRPT